MSILNFLKYTINVIRTKIGALRRDYKDLPERYPQYTIGRGCYGPLGIYTFGDAATVKIGAFCSFAVDVKIMLGGEHRSDWVTTYPFDRKYFNATNAPHSTFAKGDVVIGNDVWIGEGSLILSNTEIGDGVIIGARSIVRGKLVPYGVYIGSPAKLVRMRFEQDVINDLQAISWWNWPDEKIKKQVPLLLSGKIAEFIKTNKEA